MKTKAVAASFLLCLLVLAAFPLASHASLAAASGDPELDQVVARAMHVHGVPGASVAVVKNGEVAWARGYGLADPAQALPVTAETVFDAASVAKPVSAWGIMALVEDGLIDLDAPISQYVTRWTLPPSEYDHDLITIRRILSHTAGLSVEGDPGQEPDTYVPTVIEALNGAVLGMPALHVEYPPGEDYHYSSVGYTLIELAIEEVTGESFPAYMQKEVLDPLGMRNSSYEASPRIVAQAAVAHDWHNKPLPRYEYSTRAQGNLRTTPTDLATFLAASMPGPNGEPVGRGVLTPESVREMLTPVAFEKSAESSHVPGLGYDLIAVDGSVAGARKTGDHRGWKPIVVMAMDQRQGIAIMANSDRAAIGFLIDIACAWSSGLDEHVMQADCRELMTIRDVLMGTGVILAIAAVIFALALLRGIRSGRRKFEWRLPFGKTLLVVLLVLVLTAWWLGWHTDTLFTDVLRRYPDGAVTVRLIIPWPTAFVWVSRGLTLLLLAWISAAFLPRVKQIDRQSV
jgi:CubicO group peptidase (beta-lactamase class C family)